MKLKQSNVDKIELPVGKTAGKTGDRIEWDDDLPGFGLRIREGGSRNYIIQYKIGGQQRRKTLGSTRELTLEQARKQARKDLGRVANGEDPQAEKAAARATSTESFGAVAERFIKYQANHLRPSSLYSTTNYLRNYCKRLHALKVEAITKREIASVVSSVAENHGKVAADRCGSAISALFAWAVAEGLVEANPAVGLNKHAGMTSRDRVLKDDELAAIWLALDDDDYGRIVKLLILTGQRRDEIAGLRWSEVNGGIELTSERTKNHRSHIVPLSDLARDILGPRPDPIERDLIFGSRSGGYSGFSKSKAKLDAKLPIKAWQVHDIRRSVATGMAELGVEPHIVEAVLNHVSGHRSGVAGVYNKAVYLEPKTKALDLWANHIAVIVAQSSGANVKPLPPTRRGAA
jgi:integrase